MGFSTKDPYPGKGLEFENRLTSHRGAGGPGSGTVVANYRNLHHTAEHPEQLSHA